MPNSKGKYYPGRPGIIQANWRGVDYIRSHASSVFMSPAMMRQQQLNALSTRLGAAYRKLLGPLLPHPKSRQMQIAFRLALLRWLQQPVPNNGPCVLAGFSFTEKESLLAALCHSTTVATGPNGLAIQLPPGLPANANPGQLALSKLNFTLSAVCCLCWRTPAPSASTATSMPQPAANKSQPIALYCSPACPPAASRCWY